MPVSPDGRRPSRSRPRGAFTLIELMIVVFIIGILVAITVTMIPKVYRAVHGAQTSAQLAAIASSIQAYYADFRAYPGPLPNNVLGGAFYSPANTLVGTQCHLSSLGATSSSGVTTFTLNGFDTTQQGHVTGAENLVLGLLGGLQYDTKNSNPAATPTPLIYYAYNPNEIFPDGTIPAPKGGMNLGTTPKRSNAYLQVRAGDLSANQPLPDPRMLPASCSAGCFGDAAGHFGLDSMIPEFLDKYSQAMPILYIRASVGTSGVVSRAGLDENQKPAVYQYDLAQVLGYTSSQIGTLSKPGQDHHGLQDILPTPVPTAPNSDTVGGDWALMGGNQTAGQLGANAFAYLKDTNTPATLSDGSTATLNATAHPRQKDAFILISAGPDGVYGTADDIVYPGGSVVPQ